MGARSHRSRTAKFAPFQRHRERVDARIRADIRDCCLTSRHRPHAEDCQRGERGCRDKVGFANRRLAVIRARELAADIGTMNVYRCDSCGLWHMGHPATGDPR